MSSAPWYLNSEKPVSYMLLFVCIVFSVTYCNEKAVYLYWFVLWHFRVWNIKGNGSRIQITLNRGMTGVQKYSMLRNTARVHVQSKLYNLSPIHSITQFHREQIIFCLKKSKPTSLYYKTCFHCVPTLPWLVKTYNHLHNLDFKASS